MQLPHSTTTFEVANYVYSPDQPPVYFNNIPASTVVAPLLPTITTSIINNLVQHAGSGPFRVFAFNFYGKNNWNNRDFFDLVTFVVGYVEVDLAQGAARDMQSVIQNSIPDAVSVYLTQLLVNFPALKGIVDYQTLNAMAQNAGLLQNRMNMIINFYQRTGINSPILAQGMRQMPVQQPVSNYDPYRQAPMQGMMQPNVQSHLQQGMVGSGGQIFNTGGANNVAGAGVRQDQYFTNRKYTRDEPVQTHAVKHEVPELTMQEVSGDMWLPSKEQPYRSMCDTRFFRKRYFAENGVVIEVIERLEENEVDRSKHAITLLGSTFNMDEVVRKDVVAQQIENLKNPIAVKQEITFGEEGQEPVKPVVVQPDHSRVTCEPFLDDAIFQGRCQQRLFQKQGGKCDVFHAFTTVAHPIVTRGNYRDILTNIYNMDQFKDVARYMRRLVAESSKSDTETTTEDTLNIAEEIEKSKDKQDLIFFLDVVDKFFTDFVNSWLKNKACLTGVTIDSFAEDVESLPAFLMSKYGSEYMESFIKFQTDCIAYTFKQISEDAEMELAETIDGTENKLTYSFISEHYSIAYIDLLPKELDINLKEGECLLIPESTHWLLHHIAVGIFDLHKPSLFTPHKTLLITQDNEIYYLHRPAIGRDAFLISR